MRRSFKLYECRSSIILSETGRIFLIIRRLKPSCYLWSLFTSGTSSRRSGIVHPHDAENPKPADGFAVRVARTPARDRRLPRASPHPYPSALLPGTTPPQSRQSFHSIPSLFECVCGSEGGSQAVFGCRWEWEGCLQVLPSVVIFGHKFSFIHLRQ